jgi:general secretion pathway protein D
MRSPFKNILLLMCSTLLLAGCPKGNADFQAAKQAEAINDLDTALIHYERALRSDPRNVTYRLKATHLRFEAAQAHVAKGQKFRDAGELQLAIAEFEKAATMDPSSPVAGQELTRTMEMMAARQAQTQPVPPEAQEKEPLLLDKPPELAPISHEPINLRLTNDARIIYETIGKLAGVSVLFDSDFQPRRISTELTNVTLEQALDVVALQSKTFWKAVAGNIIFVVPDQQQKRRDYEEFVVRTFYLSNTVQAQDLTEIVNGLRQLFEFRRIQQVNSQNAIIIRDTPDKIALAEKVIRDIDKAKPEVVIQVAVLQARRDRARDLGIEPGSSSVLAFTPRNPTGGTGTSGGTSTTSNQVRLSDLQRLSSGDWSLSLPGAKATALLTDSATKIIQNPEIRAVDGQSAKLRVGDRVPIATGSFQAGLGGTAGGTGAAGFINPLVNTQFQYQEVGVNIDITPRVHANREVSLKVSIEVSSVTGKSNIGGIEQPIISQRKIEHDVRLKEGEVNVLGGLLEESQTKSISGWPGLAKIPFFRYFFSSETVNTVENEVLIVLTPRIIRLPDITAANLRSVSAGTDANPQVRRADEVPKPSAPPPAKPPAAVPPPQAPAPAPGAEARTARMRFEPAAINLKPGDTMTVNVVVEDVKDLFSIPMLLQYNPAVISIEEVRHGGFLSGGTQEIAIVQQIMKEKGQAIVSATRQPNTPGIGGTGTLVGIVIRGVAPGSCKLQIVQVNAKDSAQKPIPMVAGEAAVQVQ